MAHTFVCRVFSLVAGKGRERDGKVKFGSYGSDIRVFFLFLFPIPFLFGEKRKRKKMKGGKKFNSRFDPVGVDTRLMGKL